MRRMDEQRHDAEDSSGFTAEELEGIRCDQSNASCADCGRRDPVWVSVNNGCFLCSECAGLHRGLGVNVSYIRSLDLDKWSSAQKLQVSLFSNSWTNEFLALGEESQQLRVDRYLSDRAFLLRVAVAARSTHAENIPGELNAEQLENAQELRRDYQRRKAEILAKPLTDAERPWHPDADSTCCARCERKFTLTFRRHHCRACGRVVCRLCAPKNNSKPIPKLGYRKPVRHCRDCFESALVKFD